MTPSRKKSHNPIQFSMIWIIVLCVILVTFVVLLWGRVFLLFEWDKEGFRASIMYLELSHTFTPSKKQKVETEQEGRKDKQRSRKIGEWIRLAPDLIGPIIRLFKLLTKYGKISYLRLGGRFGLSDPYATGIAYGYIQALKGFLQDVAPVAEIDLRADFESEIIDISAGGCLRMRLASILVVSIITIVHLPKRKIWRLVRTR